MTRFLALVASFTLEQGRALMCHMVPWVASDATSRFEVLQALFRWQVELYIVLHFLVLFVTRYGITFCLLHFRLRFVVAAFFAVTLGIAAIYLRYSQPEYESSTLIQINDNNQASKVLQMTKYDEGDNKIATAMEQIHSKIFLKRVVEKSDVQISYFNEGTFKNRNGYWCH